MRKILLINPSPPSPNRRDEVPLQLLSLGNYLTKCFPNLTLEIIDFRYEERDNYPRSAAFKDVIASADVIGISCAYSEIYLNTLKTAKVCRKTSPMVPIIVGGLHVTNIPQDFTLYPNLFDYIVTGYGETAMAKIITQLAHSHFRRPAQQECVNDEPLPKGEFFQIFDLTLLKRYFQQKQRTPILYLKFSSGCTGQCRFCSDSGNFRHVMEIISPKNAIKHLHDALQFVSANGSLELSHYLTHNAEINIGDEIFGLNYAWQQSFLSRLIKSRGHFPIEEFYLGAAARVDTFREQDIPLFDKARVNISFGIESFDPSMLEIMGKTTNPRYFLKKAQTILRSPQYHLKETYNTMLMVFGFPGETAKSLAITDKNMREIIANGENPTLISPNLFFFYPSTEVWLNRERYSQQYGTKFYFPFWWRESLAKVKQSMIDPSKNFTIFDLDEYSFSSLPELLEQSMKKVNFLRPQAYFQEAIKSWKSLLDKIPNVRELRFQLLRKKDADPEEEDADQCEDG